MANNAKVRSNIKEFLQKMKALDSAIPEELAEDALEMVNGVNDALNEEVQDENADVLEVAKDEGGEEMSEKKIEDTLTKVLMKHGIIKDSSMSALDAAENDLVEDEDEPDDEGENDDGDDDGKANDSAANIRKAIRAMKPIVASIKDSKQRKIMSDNLASLIKSAGTSKTNDQYADILKISRSAAKSANDSKPTADSDVDFGKDIAKRFNPHYMTKEDK